MYMQTKDNQRIVVTKRMLQEGLQRLLKTRDLDKITVAELCQEAGINRSTFYRHYSLSRDVLQEMQAEFVEEMRRTLQDQQGGGSLVQVLTYLQKHTELVILLLRYNSDKEWTELFRYIYQSICGTKVIGYLDGEDQKLFYTFLSGGTYFLLRQWLCAGVQKSPEEVAGIVQRIINQNILP